MFILQADQVNYCTLRLPSTATDKSVQVPGLEYQHKLYVRTNTYRQQDSQTALQNARQKLLDLKGRIALLVEDGDTITLWCHEKQAQKVDAIDALDLKQLVAAMRDIGGIQIKDRQFHLKTYPQCFVGAEAVDWLANHFNTSREQAMQVGKRLMDENWIHHVVDEQPFQDDYFFYRFRWDET